MPGLTIVSTTALIRPTKPPMKAPRVVRPFHSIDSSSTGKLALAATAKARPTMKATLIFSNSDAEHDGDDAEHDRGDPRRPDLGGFVDLAVPEHAGVEVVADRAGARQREARHHREDRREGDRRDEALHQIAADRVREMDRRHVAAAEQSALGVVIDRIRSDEHDRAEADDEGQDVEIADEGGRPEHRLARFLGVADGEEAHQDVRQAGGAEHQRHAERDRRDRVGDLPRPAA